MEENTTKQENTENPKVAEEKDIKDNKAWALLSYLGVLVLVPLIGKTDSSFAQFHAKQGLVILGGWVLSWLPFGFVFAVAAIVFSVLGLINVAKGEKKKLPIIGDLAEKINI
ncbi:MAG: hypothetical protein US70_C0011G0028 [Parcubacteria group bacterium GW2011_GWD2_38_11]|nr:MAG: hypothetical protein US70_C0011G0028 [Parcubacteria group bacterium GW2011_GWD2_38_11]